MPPLSNARIQRGEQNSTGQQYHIDATEGYVNADLTYDSKYRISFYRVHDSFRDQGYGQELLQLAKEHAKHLGADAIISSNITSDESAGAMAAVFGHQYLTGGVDPKKITSAVELFPTLTVDYPIQDDDPPLRSDVQIIDTPRQPTISPIRQYWNNRR